MYIGNTENYILDIGEIEYVDSTKNNKKLVSTQLDHLCKVVFEGKNS